MLNLFVICNYVVWQRTIRKTGAGASVHFIGRKRCGVSPIPHPIPHRTDRPRPRWWRRWWCEWRTEHCVRRRPKTRY